MMFHAPGFGEEEFDFLHHDKADVSRTSQAAGCGRENQTPPSVCYTPPFSHYSSTQSLEDILDFSPTFVNSTLNSTPKLSLSGNNPVLNKSPPASAAHFGRNFPVFTRQQTYNLQLPVPQFSTSPMMNLPRQMTTHRDSILESLESIAPKFPPQNLDIPDIEAPTTSTNSSGFTTTHMIGKTANSQRTHPDITSTGLDGGFQMQNANAVSPSNSSMSTTSPPRDGSEDSDDNVPLAQLMKRQAQEEPVVTKPVVVKVNIARKARTPRKKKKKDPNEPQKPVSAYALFFRDTQAAIKGPNPNATFGEVSKIVASMWEGLDPEHKNEYKKKTELAKKEYLKQLAAYRASLVSQTPMDEGMSVSPPHHSPLGTSPQHIMGYMNNTSPQHMASPAHMGNPAHMASPAHMVGSPAHISSPTHMGSPAHLSNTNPPHMTNSGLISSPAHLPSPGHMTGPLHATSPAHMTSPMHVTSSDHVASPQHVSSPNNIPSPQQAVMFNFNNQSPHQQYNNMGGYTNGPITELIESNGMHMDAGLPSSGGNGGRIIPSGMCIRSGCHNRAIENIGWDNEYCSNECVVSHCRDVFTAWVANRQVPVNNAFTVK